MDEPIKVTRPNPDVDRVAYYHSEATRCRAMADATHYQDLKDSYLRVAQQWADLARQAATGLSFILPPELDEPEKCSP
jgi:hypothetical protein